MQDCVAGARLLDQVAADHPGIRKVWLDGGYRRHLVEHAATLGIDMEITDRTPGAMGFTPIPERWAVERTYGWRICTDAPATTTTRLCPPAPRP